MKFKELAEHLIRRDNELMEDYMNSPLYNTIEGQLRLANCRSKEALELLLTVIKSMPEVETNNV